MGLFGFGKKEDSVFDKQDKAKNIVENLSLGKYDVVAKKVYHPGDDSSLMRIIVQLSYFNADPRILDILDPLMKEGVPVVLCSGVSSDSASSIKNFLNTKDLKVDYEINSSYTSKDVLLTDSYHRSEKPFIVEKGECNVIIENYIFNLFLLRDLIVYTGKDFSEVQDMLKKVPCTVFLGIDAASACIFKYLFERYGATVTIEGDTKIESYERKSDFVGVDLFMEKCDYSLSLVHDLIAISHIELSGAIYCINNYPVNLLRNTSKEIAQQVKTELEKDRIKLEITETDPLLNEIIDNSDALNKNWKACVENKEK